MYSFSENTQKFLSIFTSCIGIYAIIWWCTDYLTTVFEFFKIIFSQGLSFRVTQTLQEKYGQWAVITGATDGIGKQYALELAKQGMNICIIARSETKLIEVANEIERNYKVPTKFIVADFSNRKYIYDIIKTHLQRINVGILINNVGMMYEYPDEFDQIPVDSIWKMINVNIGAVTMMSKIVIPQMKIRNRGLILNVSSGAHSQPIPLAAVYAATKSFTKSFTIALRRELAGYNVKVHLLIPMFVRTKLIHFVKTPESGNIFLPNAKYYVGSSVQTLGLYTQTCGYWNHSIQYKLLNLIPEFVRVFITHTINKKLKQEHYDQQNSKQIT